MPIRIEIEAQDVLELRGFLATLVSLALPVETPVWPLDTDVSAQQSATTGRPAESETVPASAPRKRGRPASPKEAQTEAPAEAETPAETKPETGAAKPVNGTAMPEDETVQRNRIVEGMTRLFMTKNPAVLAAITDFKTKHGVKMMRELDAAVFADAFAFIDSWSEKAAV